MVLAGHQICVTGVTSVEEKGIRQVIAELGGEFTTAMAKGETSCLLVRKVGSEKHRKALDWNVPTVEVQWLKDCKNSNKALPFDNYLVRPFLGLNVSCTGYEAEERFLIQKTVEENGGAFSATMVKDKCTHLVAEAVGEGAGNKYTVAKSWGNVHIVTKKWVEDCHEAKRYLQEYKYVVEARDGGAGSSTAGGGGGAGGNGGRSARKQPPSTVATAGKPARGAATLLSDACPYPARSSSSSSSSSPPPPVFFCLFLCEE